MRKSQRGFTLIELVTVIVVLGILSAVAIPKYIDYRESAGLAAVKGVAAALASASAVNYAASVARLPNARSVKTCTDVAGLLVGGGLPVNFAIENSDQTGAVASVATPDAMTTPTYVAPIDEVAARDYVAGTAAGGTVVTAVARQQAVAGVTAVAGNNNLYAANPNSESVGIIKTSGTYTCIVKSGNDSFKAMATFSFTPI